MKKRNPNARPFRDFRRLVSPQDLLGRAGLLMMRKSIVKAALGADYENAVAVLERTLLSCFEFATDLRIRYDPEYCDESLESGLFGYESVKPSPRRKAGAC